MTDKELLEMAAKAAGWTGWRSKHGYWNVTSPEGRSSTHCHHWNSYCPDTGKKLREPTFADAISETNWNPLTDDGDALRLAVKLKIQITPGTYNKDEFTAFKAAGGEAHEFCNFLQDEYAATRRAIVRAAAEIGKAMK
jgi:hypothetical protein